MADLRLRVNGTEKKVNVVPETPLLWVLRDTLALTGTKFGCGAGLCGACTVHVDGAAVRSCSTPVSQVTGKNITTIEGLGANGLHVLQQAWIAEEVPQCGYCQTGQIMTAAALLAKTPNPSDDQITQAMNGNLCRCGTYERIRKAIHRAASAVASARQGCAMSPLSRREFVVAGVAAGAGLVVGFYLPHGKRGNPSSFSPNAYLRITPDNKITIVVARSEMGQGVRTALPMILAEELEADWKQIEIEQAGASTLYGDQTTGGSASVRTTWDPMRKAGAAAREMLISAAALTWGVPRSSCSAQSGSIVHAASKRQMTYGELVEKASTLPIPTDVTLKQSKDYKIVGQRLPRVDTPSKVKGEAVFGIDFRLPGMKYALLSRCPTIGGKLASFDDKESRKSSGRELCGEGERCGRRGGSR